MTLAARNGQCKGESPLPESPEKWGGTVSSFRLGMNPQAIWLRRTNPAFKQLEAVVSKHARLVAKSPLKAPFMGRSGPDIVKV